MRRCARSARIRALRAGGRRRRGGSAGHARIQHRRLPAGGPRPQARLPRHVRCGDRGAGGGDGRWRAGVDRGWPLVRARQGCSTRPSCWMAGRSWRGAPSMNCPITACLTTSGSLTPARPRRRHPLPAVCLGRRKIHPHQRPGSRPTHPVQADGHAARRRRLYRLGRRPARYVLRSVTY